MIDTDIFVTILNKHIKQGKEMRKAAIVLFILLYNIHLVNANDLFIGIKFFGLSIHPTGALNSQHMPLKFDKEGKFVLNTGATINIEYFIYKDIISTKFVQGLYGDCVQKLGGFSHLGLRGKIFRYEKHSLYGGVGPTFIYRENWYSLEEYDDGFSFFRGKPEDKWQYRFFWYGGEFEYNYEVKNNLFFSTSFVPGFPDLANLSIGFRGKFLINDNK